MLRPKVSWWCSYISYRLHTHTRPKVSHPPLTTCRACTTVQNHVTYYILQYSTEFKRGWVQEGRTNGGGIHDSMHAFTRLRVNPIRAWYTTTAGYSGTSDSDSSTNQWLVGSASAAVSISRNATVRLVEPQLVCIPMILCSKASAWVHGWYFISINQQGDTGKVLREDVRECTSTRSAIACPLKMLFFSNSAAHHIQHYRLYSGIWTLRIVWAWPITLVCMLQDTLPNLPCYIILNLQFEKRDR